MTERLEDRGGTGAPLADPLAALDEGGGAGTFDAIPAAVDFGDVDDVDRGLADEPAWVDASEPRGLEGEGGVAWRRAVEVFIVLFEGLEAVSFSSTRGGLRE